MSRFPIRSSFALAVLAALAAGLALPDDAAVVGVPPPDVPVTTVQSGAGGDGIIIGLRANEKGGKGSFLAEHQGQKSRIAGRIVFEVNGAPCTFDFGRELSAAQLAELDSDTAKTEVAIPRASMTPVSGGIDEPPKTKRNIIGLQISGGWLWYHDTIHSVFKKVHLSFQWSE